MASRPRRDQPQQSSTLQRALIRAAARLWSYTGWERKPADLEALRQRDRDNARARRARRAAARLAEAEAKAQRTLARRAATLERKRQAKAMGMRYVAGMLLPGVSAPADGGGKKNAPPTSTVYPTPRELLRQRKP